MDPDSYEITGREAVTGGTELTVGFTYLDVHATTCTAEGRIYLPEGLEAPVPLMFLAGYELDFAACSEYLERGWAVANPVTPEIPESWAWDNQLARSVNLDVAFLHIARAQPFVDDARVMISGASTGGWMCYMLAAETFPLAGCAPDVAPVDLAYCVGYFLANEEVSRGTLPDGRTPAVPAIALIGAPLAHQVTEVLGSDLRAPIWADHSPVAHVDRITCPVHALHSTADVCMPLTQVCGEDATGELSEFPSGFRLSQRELDLPERRLSDAVPDVEFVRLSVPDGAELHDIMALLEGVAPSPDNLPHLVAPAGRSRWTVCILDEGPPGPWCGHVKHELRINLSRCGVDRQAFWQRVIDAPVAVDQLTDAKLRALLGRYVGREWIESPLRHLDSPDAERADVLRGLSTYRAQSPVHDSHFRRLYAKMPSELKVLDI